MSPLKHSTNLAARMGRWSAGHWKTATFGWLALVVVAFAVGGLVGTKQVDPNTAGPGESGRMDRILDSGFKLPADESVLIQSGSVRAGAPAFDSAVADVVARVSKVAAVQNVRSPLDPANAGQIAKGGHAALVEFEIRGEKKNAGDKLGPVLKSVADEQRAHPGFFVGEFGGASAAKAVDTAFADDLKSAGVFSIPLTLIILVPPRPSRENVISMPSVRRKVCARRSRPASARGFLAHALPLDMSSRALSHKRKRSDALPVHVIRLAMIARTQVAMGSASMMFSMATLRFAA